MVVGVGSVEKTVTMLPLFLQGAGADGNCCSGLVVLEASFSMSF